MASVNKKFMLANRISVFDFDFCAFTSTNLLLELCQNSLRIFCSAFCCPGSYHQTLSLYPFSCFLCASSSFPSENSAHAGFTADSSGALVLSVRPLFWTRIFWHHIWCLSLYYRITFRTVIVHLPNVSAHVVLCTTRPYFR